MRPLDSNHWNYLIAIIATNIVYPPLTYQILISHYMQPECQQYSASACLSEENAPRKHPQQQQQQQQSLLSACLNDAIAVVF